MSSWIKNNLALIFVGVVIAAFLFPVWLQGKVPLPADTLVGLYHPYRDFFANEYPSGIPYKNFLITDPIRQQYIWKKFAIEQSKAGNIPWWNPYTHSGMPFLANIQAGIFYPLNIIFWIAPFVDAWTIFIALQSILGAIFMYAYLRQQKLHSLACILGTMSFIFSGFFIVWWEWGNIGHTILWLPAILWTIDKYSSSHKTKYLTLHALLLISSFFAGHLQTWFYIAAVSFIYAFINIKSKLLVIGIWSLVTITTAIQWLPAIQLIKLSARDLDQSQIFTRPDWFIPWQHLAQVLAPDFFGNPATLNYWGIWNYAEFVGYIGLIPLIFALGTFRNKSSTFWWLVVFTGLIFALPTPIAKTPFILKIPFLSLAQPSRLLSLVVFALAVLSAYGLNNYIHLKSKKPLLLSAGIVSIALAILWFSTTTIVPDEHISVARRNLILPSINLVTFLFILALSNFAPKRLLRAICYLLFLAIVADQLRFANKFISFSPREYIFPETAAIKFLKSDPGIFRIMSLDRRILPPNTAMYYGLHTVEGYDPLYLKSYASLITEMETGQKQDQPASFNRIISPTNIASNLINKLNVKYVLSLTDLNQPWLKLVFQEGDTRVYQNLNVLPRAQLLIESDPVTIKLYTPNKIILELNTQTPNTLELADMMYPGWKALVDNQAKAIITSAENLRQVIIPSGNHQVVFEYVPKL